MAIQIFVKVSSVLGFKHISYQHEDNKGGRNVFTKSIGMIKGKTLQVLWTKKTTLVHFKTLKTHLSKNKTNKWRFKRKFSTTPINDRQLSRQKICQKFSAIITNTCVFFCLQDKM